MTTCPISEAVADDRAQRIRRRVWADQAALRERKGQNPIVDAHSLRASVVVTKENGA